MKLTKSGEIEACCGILKHYYLERGLLVSRKGKMVGLKGWLRFLKPKVIFMYCPNCGSKTEIEGDEKESSPNKERE